MSDPMLTPPEPAVVIQSDREAAADIWRDYVAKIGECIVERGMREGRMDNGLPTMLAAHRLAHSARPDVGGDMVLVPREPTEAMYEAGYDATRLADGTPQFADAGFCLGHSGKIYRAMISAAMGEVVL